MVLGFLCNPVQISEAHPNAYEGGEEKSTLRASSGHLESVLGAEKKLDGNGWQILDKRKLLPETWFGWTTNKTPFLTVCRKKRTSGRGIRFSSSGKDAPVWSILYKQAGATLRTSDRLYSGESFNWRSKRAFSYSTVFFTPVSWCWRRMRAFFA